MRVFILIVLFISYCKSSHKVSPEFDNIEFETASQQEESIPPRKNESTSTTISNKSSTKPTEPWIAEKEYSINDLIVEFEVHVDVQQACLESTKFLLDLFGNKQNKDKENGNKENKSKLKNETILKLFKASEAIVGEVKKLIGEFEEVLDNGLKEELDEQEDYKRRFYKNQGRRLRDLDLYYHIPEGLFLDSLPDYIMGGLKDYDTDNEFKTNRARLFSKFLSNKEDVCVENEEDNEEEGEVVVVEEDVKENPWQKAYNAFKRQLSGKKQGFLKKQESLKTQGSFKKEEPLTRHESLKKLGSWKKQNSLKTQGSFNETLKNQGSLKTQGSFIESLKKQNSFSLKNFKPNWKDVVKYTTRLNDICKVFKMKDVDNLLLTKKDKFYFDIEHRKNLRKLNRLVDLREKIKKEEDIQIPIIHIGKTSKQQHTIHSYDLMYKLKAIKNYQNYLKTVDNTKIEGLKKIKILLEKLFIKSNEIKQIFEVGKKLCNCENNEQVDELMNEVNFVGS